MIKLESTLVGVAGEYLVAGELTLRGYIASITLRNSREVDIIAANTNASMSVTIQVKTNSSGARHWMLNKKSENYFSGAHFYVFVALKQLHERPNFHIVPSQIIAEYVKTSHADWLKGTKSDGSSRKDTSMRKFHHSESKYLEAWHLLTL